MSVGFYSHIRTSLLRINVATPVHGTLSPSRAFNIVPKQLTASCCMIRENRRVPVIHGVNHEANEDSATNCIAADRCGLIVP